MSNGILTMSAFENQDEILSTTKGDACSEYSLKHTQRKCCLYDEKQHQLDTAMQTMNMALPN